MSTRTPAQIAASRANGAKSRGPITDEGKRVSAANAAHSTGPRTHEGKSRVAQNALKHGALAKSLMLPGEDNDEFIHMLDVYKERHQPADEVEERAVERLVFAEWRLRRIQTFETACLSWATILEEAAADPAVEQQSYRMPQLHAALAFTKLADTGRTLSLICRYESMLDRQASRARAEIREFQAVRRESAEVIEHPEANPDADTKQTEPENDSNSCLTPSKDSSDSSFPIAEKPLSEPQCPAATDSQPPSTKQTGPNPQPPMPGLAESREPKPKCDS